MWDYLGQFWNSVASTTINAWEYTEDWFFNIGNAVAGAIGGLFSWFLHYINDLFVFFGWLFEVLLYFLNLLILPIVFVFDFFSNFITSAFASPSSNPTGWALPLAYKNLLYAIPYFDDLATALGIFISFLISIYIVKFVVSNFK